MMGAVGGDARWCLELKGRGVVGGGGVPINCKTGMKIINTTQSPLLSLVRRGLCFGGISSKSNKLKILTMRML